MAIVIYRRPAGTGLTPEELAMLEEAEKLPIKYDEDCPKLTEEELAEFKPVNFATMEERAQAMKRQKITIP
ncbi:MAG: hypothetical protein LBQ94_03710 [Treponema sp.]|jgi:hypothetical protein|nr:hypothetical protein [Treponema sp.]